MNKSTIKTEILSEIEILPANLQNTVLSFVRFLMSNEHKKSGSHGKSLLKFAGSIDKSDLKIIQDSIDEGCEKTDANEW